MPKDDARIQLLSRVARAGGVSASSASSILALSAAAYGARPSDEATVPTGFDPYAVALFETIVEGAYIVANVDGHFDDAERKAFEKVVVGACGGAVTQKQIQALLADLGDQLKEDGIERRISTMALSVHKREQAMEVLRIAALLADASEGVSEVERATLEKIAGAFRLEPGDVDTAIEDVRKALASA